MTNWDVQLIPVPKQLQGSGDFTIVKTCVTCQYEPWRKILPVITEATQKLHGICLTEGDGGLSLVYDPDMKAGAYHLNCDSGITLRAKDYEGICYGIASFLQLSQGDKGNLLFPRVDISDWPDKEHRGFMVDLARWWHPKQTILAYLDLCFFYKIKYLHLHFADNQSYTLPSAAFPKLPTEDRHYSFSDIQEIRDYARTRGILLIPEIEMPGHAIPLNDSYPELFMDRTPDGYLAQRKKTPTVICAGSKHCFEALTKLIDEVLDLFPDSPYIHLGGDEAAIEVWEHCEVCREYMIRNGISSAKELYSEFTARVTDYVLEKGRTPVVWEGFPREASHRISKKVLVMAWECYYNQPEDLLEDGFSIINCAWKPLYLCPGTTDWTYRDILRWHVGNMQNFSAKSRATHDPVNLPPSDQILGAQLCAWEACYEYEIHPIVDMMAAFTERLWESIPVCSEEVFDQKLKKLRTKAYRLIQQR